jgi:hypothetical protein
VIGRVRLGGRCGHRVRVDEGAEQNTHGLALLGQHRTDVDLGSGWGR